MLSLERPLALGLLGEVGAMGEAVCDDLNLCRLGERSAARGLDSSSARHPVGIQNVQAPQNFTGAPCG